MKSRNAWGRFKFLEVMVAEPTVYHRLPKMGSDRIKLGRCLHLPQGSLGICLVSLGGLRQDEQGGWPLSDLAKVEPEGWARSFPWIVSLLGQGQGSSGEPTGSTMPGSLGDIWGGL